MVKLATFSIVARCPETGMLGVAVSTAVPAVGDLCAFVAPGVGAIATQSWVNPYLGIDGLRLLGDGLSAHEAMSRIIDNEPNRELRQVGMVDRKGTVAAFTGESCTDWCGHEIGDAFCVQGNMLKGPDTIIEMAQSARDSIGLTLPERLIKALEAGQAVGGDKRGKQSAYVRVYDTEEYPYLSLSVDDNADPILELRRIYGVAQAQLIPFVSSMPTRLDPGRVTSDEAIDILSKRPQDRPNK